MAQRPRDYASADYWGLDSLQAPVFGTDKPVLALAGPGSGKTRTIIAKAARLIEQNDWNTRSVALVTFTKAAAEEMRTRLQKAMPKNVTLSPRNTFIGTFHALSFRLLTAHWKKVGQINKVLTDYEASALVGQAANGFPAEKNSVPELMASIARYKSLPKGYEFTAVDKESDHFKIFLAYEEKRSKLNALEKNDLVRECLALIHQKVINPLPVAHLLSDETQDADFVQIDWILAHYAAGIVPTVVADDDQSIYAFRHAAGFAGLQRYATAVGAEILPMTFNYRSGKAIVDAAQGIVAASPNRFPKTIEAKRDSKGSLLALRYPSEADQAEWVVREAGEWLNSNAGSSAAIISRTNAELDLIEIACKAQQIPYLRVGSSDFLQREHLQRTLLAVRLRLKPEDAIGFAASAGVGVKFSPVGMR